MTNLQQEDFDPRKILESDAEGILRQFLKGAPWCVSVLEKLLKPESLVVVGREKELDAWRKSTTTRVCSVLYNPVLKWELMSKAAPAIDNYVTLNKGWSKTADPYKIVYWYGVEFAKELAKTSKHDAMVALIATVELLNSFLRCSGKPTLHREMMEKLHRSIAEDRIGKEFGEHGIYFVFKSLAKVAS